MAFPPLSHLAKAALVALLLAVIGFVATPSTGWLGSPAADAALMLAIGALLGGWLSAIRRGGTVAAPGETHHAGSQDPPPPRLRLR